LDADVVERYAADMERGDRFPPLLALARPRRKPMLLGGNHRYTAAVKAARSTLPVYVVDAEPETATRLMYEDNRRHGLPPSDDERVAQAIHLIDTGWTQAAACECVGITVGKVQTMQFAVRAERRARTMGIGGFAALPKYAKARLAGIRSDPAFGEASKLVIATGMASTELQEFVSKVNACRSDQDALRLVATETDRLRESIQRKAGGDTTRRPPTARARMLTAIGLLGGCDPIDVTAGCASKDQAASLGRQLVDVRKRIDATLAELQRQWK